MIEAYEFGRIRVDGREYRKDLKVYPDRIEPDWRREAGHELRVADLPELPERGLTHLVVGCGAHGMLRVTPEAEAWLAGLGLPFTALPTAAAVEEFNRRFATGERVGLVAHLTC